MLGRRWPSGQPPQRPLSSWAPVTPASLFTGPSRGLHAAATQPSQRSKPIPAGPFLVPNALSPDFPVADACCHSCTVSCHLCRRPSRVTPEWSPVPTGLCPIWGFNSISDHWSDDIYGFAFCPFISLPPLPQTVHPEETPWSHHLSTPCPELGRARAAGAGWLTERVLNLSLPGAPSI